MKIAFVGLGTMGGAIAGHIRAAGHDMCVFNRSDDRASAWIAQHGGMRASTLAEAAQGAAIVFTCLSDDRATADVVIGAGGLLDAIEPGAILVDHGSGMPACARHLADRASERDVAFLDAPVTGGGKAAQAGTLAIMVGGAPDIIERATPVMRSYASDIVAMGGVGSGQMTKLVNVVIGHGTGMAVAEGLGFAIAAGLNPQRVVDVLLKGSSRSWQLENRSAAMIARDFHPHYPLSMARKDLGNVLSESRSCGATLPLTALADQFLAGLEQRYGVGEDVASLIRFFVPGDRA
jgi:3-hydroxyisobutyrate dehydrogenase-like beta-hydroxyacid dehydrogenase